MAVQHIPYGATKWPRAPQSVGVHPPLRPSLTVALPQGNERVKEMTILLQTALGFVDQAAVQAKHTGSSEV